jgi:hypothetical protein
MKISKILFQNLSTKQLKSKERIVEDILIRELSRELEGFFRKKRLEFNESAVESVSKLMLKIIPDRVKKMIPDITATISRELSDHDIDRIIDKLLQDKETFQRITQKLMNRLMNSRC